MRALWLSQQVSTSFDVMMRALVNFTAGILSGLEWNIVATGIALGVSAAEYGKVLDVFISQIPISASLHGIIPFGFRLVSLHDAL